MSEIRKLDFVNVKFSQPITCDGCKKKLIPRKDIVFKDFTYGVTYCLECRSLCLKNQALIKIK